MPGQSLFGRVHVRGAHVRGAHVRGRGAARAAMCGRFLLTTPAEALREAFGFVEQPNLAPRYNIAPTQDVPVIRQRRKPAGERTLQMLRWGLVPSWAASLAGGAKMINARAETIAGKPAFRDAFARRRCLVPADGFYEWRPGDATKQPYRIAARDGAPLAFAGLWERWSPREADGIESAQGKRPYVDSFTIVTTEANTYLTPLHHRMPVILPPAARAMWLDPAATSADLIALLRPAPDDLLHYVPVDRRINNVRNDGAAAIESGTPA
jgi:putative SOS response-associated peptidase YedK